MYQKKIVLGLSDTAFFMQVRRGAILDKVHICRLDWLTENNFSKDILAGMGIEALIQKDSLAYFDLSKIQDNLLLNLRLDGMSSDGSRFRLECNVMHDSHGVLMQIHSTGVWQTSKTKSPVAPPDSLRQIFLDLGKTAVFTMLASAVQ